MDCRRVSNVSFLWKPILFIDILEIKGFKTKTESIVSFPADLSLPSFVSPLLGI